jgi:hypothetical protein
VDDGGSIDVLQELDDFNLRCWLYLNNNKLVLEYCASVLDVQIEYFLFLKMPFYS